MGRTLSSFFGLTRLFCLSSLLASASLLAQVNAVITNVTYVGDGCPPGSVAVSVSPDSEVVSLVFSNYVVEKNGAIDLGPQRKDCNLDITYHAEPYWQHAFASTLFEGSADIQSGLDACQHIVYRMDHDAEEHKLGFFEITGPYANDYQREDQVAVEDLHWQGCGHAEHTLHLRTWVEVVPTNGSNSQSGFVSVNFAENNAQAEASQDLGVRWRPCPRYVGICASRLVNTTDGTYRQRIFRGWHDSLTQALLEASVAAVGHCVRQENRLAGLRCDQQPRCEVSEVFSAR